MRTTIRLEGALLEAAKAEAEQRGTTFTSLVALSLQRELGRSKHSRKKRKVTIPVSDTSGPPFKGIDLTSNAQVWEILDGPDDSARR